MSSISKNQSEESFQEEPSLIIKTIPHKKVQTAEGWKRSQTKIRKSSKPVSKS